VELRDVGIEVGRITRPMLTTWYKKNLKVEKASSI